MQHKPGSIFEAASQTLFHEAVDDEGNTLKVGDSVEFKSDIEQVGVITKISGSNLTLEPPHGQKFHGSYIGNSKSTVVYSGRVTKI